MTVKTLILTLFLGTTLALGGMARAQNSATEAPHLNREQLIAKRLAHLRKALDLSDAQTAQLKSIWQQNAAKLKADRVAVRSAAPKSEARKTAMQQMRTDGQAMRKEMASVLTPEQLKKFKQIRLRMVKRRIHRLQRQQQRLQK